MSALLQQTSEWLEMRRTKVGASDAPVIMGDSPWKTPYQLWEQKILGFEQKKTVNMERGIAMEPQARDLFMQKTETYVQPTVVFHPEYEWMMASLDGMDPEGKLIVEIKCPKNAADHNLAKKGEIPEHYYAQLQHQMEVCQLEEAHYFSYNGREGIDVMVYRNDPYIKKMIKKEKQFWDCMQTWTPPDMITGKDTQIIHDDLWKENVKLWMLNQKQIKELEEKDKEYRQNFISMANGKNSLGYGVRVSKVIRKGNVDYSLVPQLEGIDLDPYRKAPSEGWRITTDSATT